MPAYGEGVYGAGLYPDAWASLVNPVMVLEWAPLDPPTSSSPTWVDISSRLYEFEWSYGRDDETGEFQAGTGYVVLDNRDRALDPSNTAGPWYGNIKPRRLFRLRADWNDVLYPVFFAHARRYPQSYPGLDKRVVVELADDLALLKSIDLDALDFNRPAEISSDRLDAILDEAGIPSDRRDLEEGTVFVSSTDDQVDDQGSGTDAAKQVADSEFWPLYVTRAGSVATL